jgi:outer membrane receptor protein involved in Fe transport
MICAAVLLLFSISTQTSVAGVVVDVSGAAVAGARVQIAGAAAPAETTTDRLGHFELAVPTLPSTLIVGAQGFADSRTRVDAASTTLRIVLEPRRISEEVTVSAVTPRRLATPSSSTTIDGATLRSAPAITLDDQLRSVPGFSLFRRSSSRVANPTTQGVTLRGMSASGASRTVVLADGVPLNDPFGGWVYWDRVPIASIERVEVSRGGASDLLGSDAVGGAIRIDSATSGARLIAEGGGSDTGRVSGFAGRSFGQLSARGAMETFSTGGFVTVAPESRGPIDTRATSRYTSLWGGGEGTAGNATSAGVTAGYFTEKRGNGTPYQKNDTQIRNTAGWLRAPGLSGFLSFRGYLGEQDYNQTFSAVAADRKTERPTNAQHVDASTVGASGDWLKSMGRSTLLAGASYRRVEATLEDQAFAVSGAVTTAVTDANQTTGGMTVQLSTPVGDRTTVSAGLRADHWSSARPGISNNTAGFLQPRASIAFRATPVLTLRGGIQSGYRAPTVNELYRDFRVGNTLTQANANLGPERSLGLEGAALVTYGPLVARVTGFTSRLSDSVVNVTLSSGATILRQRQNAGRIRARGVEVETEWRPISGLALTASAAFIDSTFVEGAGLEGLRVPQVPRGQSAVGIRTAWTHVNGWVEWRFVGPQFDDDRNQFELAKAHVVDARASWMVRRRLEVFGALENAFDEEVDVGKTPLRTIGMPRTARGGVRIGF